MINSGIADIHARAVSAVNQGRYREADELCDKILRQDTTYAEAWFLKSMAAAGQMEVAKALSLIPRAIKLAPQNPDYWAQFAKLCSLVNEDKRAGNAADQANKLDPQNALTLDTLGVVFTKLGRYHEAQQCLQRAVAKAPQNAQFHFNLASAEQFLGNETQAEEHYRAALRINPGFARAHWAVSELRKNTDDSERQESLESLLAATDLSDSDELYLSHALSRIYESQGRYAEAFELLQRGKFRYRAKLNYSWRVDERLFAAVEKAFPLSSTINVPEQQGAEAIFVLGMPRSGTTLVERILSSHHDVESLGELQNFGLAVRKAVQTDSHLVLDQKVLEKTEHIDFARLGEEYLSSLMNRTSGVSRFIDKMPLNFLYLGHIVEALPAAKIVLLRRNPMDTCLSNFRQLFAVSFSYYNYHYDLIDTGHYFRMFDQLMQRWQQLYSDRIHVVDYESLVENPEQEVRSLLTYCGLEWDPACLQFHKNKSAVATASAMQVRQPIYSGSIARWEKYQQQLAPLMALFDSAGIDYR